jgi:hypothetical protein
MLKLCPIILVLLFLLFPFSSPANDTTYRVLDEKWNIKKFLKEKDGFIELYDKNWNRKGFIKKEKGHWELFDNNWDRKGTINDIEEHP